MIDFQFDNMYDGCVKPSFDTYGINNPCPKHSELSKLGKRIEKEELEQKIIASDLAILMIDWVDECGADQKCYETGTGWSFVWAWNAASCIVMGCNFIVIAVGAFFWWPRLIGTMLNYLLCCCHLVGFVTMIT